MPGNKGRGKAANRQRAPSQPGSSTCDRGQSKKPELNTSASSQEVQEPSAGRFTSSEGERDFQPSTRKSVSDETPRRGAIAKPTAVVSAGTSETETCPRDTKEVQVTGQLSRLTLSETSPPKRPGYGTKGRPIKLRSNFFKITLPDGDLHHYDVTVTPSCSREISRVVVEQLAELYKRVFTKEKPTFDGRKNMYLRNPIPGIGKEKVDFIVKHNFGDHEKEFKVSVKHVAVISMEALEMALKGSGAMAYDTIQALDVVMRHLPSLCYVPVGRSFFLAPDYNGPDYIDLGSGREIWYGYHQSLRPSQWGMLLNVDVSATAFYKGQKVLDFLMDILGERVLKETKGLRDADRVKFRKEIKGLKVETTHLGKRKRKVNDVTSLPASRQTFPFNEEGKPPVDMTVANYFQRQYKIKLQYPFLPCLQVGDKARHNYLPLELCNIAGGQRCVKKLSDDQTKQMIRGTSRDANAREKEILRLVKQANYQQDEYVQGFGIHVIDQMVEVQGQILDPPGVEYKSKRDGSRKSINPQDGKWEMKDSCFVTGVSIDSWAIILCCQPKKLDDNDVRKFANQLHRSASQMGMEMKRDPDACKYASPQAVEKVTLDITKSHPNLQLLIFIISPTIKDLYARVKTIGDQLIGIPNQVVKLITAQKAHPQSLSNLCQKINAKIGGVNNNISEGFLPKIFEKPVIILGADVTHPSPGDDKKPSIAAVVGSLNRSASKYCTTVRVQKHRQEIIAELKDMTKELLKNFYQSTRGKKPERIIMYRDGVSEGQFQQVLEHELMAIRQACIELGADYKPGITFVVVQKRHHARFFPRDRADAHGKSKNVPPGTLVEKTVCHPSQYDFYLCSHAGIQGTSRPSHYHVLWDDNKICADDLHQLTYMLCHVFFRCTRAVSIPTPAYYAHLVAFRARHHLADSDRETTDSDDSLASSKEAQRICAEEAIKALSPYVKPHENMLREMYFV